MKNKPLIRIFIKSDESAVWEIIKRVIKKGDTYVFDPKSSKAKMMSYWLDPSNHVFVVEFENEICGSYILKDNQPDLGSHIANGSYMVHPDFQGKGIGRMMGEHSLQQAKIIGYKALQFNIVVSSNKPAILLWKKLGFKVIGNIPNAFNHKKLGLTDALIMFREI